MRILLTGGQGQLGRALQKLLQGDTIFAPSRDQLDVTDFRQVQECVKALAPHIVVHAAALTDTRRCEAEPDLAYRVNALGTQHLAVAAERAGIPIAYISTNEVFDGRRAVPYLEYDEPAPINAYGRSKLAGEWAVQSLTTRHYIIRTAWLYSEGEANFPARILRLAMQGPLRVVTDEISTPTLAHDLALGLSQLIRSQLYGVYHLTNEGECSRFEWAEAILKLAGYQEVPLIPTTLAEFGAYPPKPPYTVLRNYAAATSLGVRLRPWREALEAMFTDYRRV